MVGTEFVSLLALCPTLPNSCVEALISSVTRVGDRAFREVIKVK